MFRFFFTGAGLDFYGCVKLVNYVRTEMSGSAGAVEDLKVAAAAIETAVVSSQGGVFADERCGEEGGGGGGRRVAPWDGGRVEGGPSSVLVV